jgi:hypothetical protein
MVVIAVSTAIIVGNVDRRLGAAWRWLKASNAADRSSASPSGTNMRVSYAPPQAVTPGQFGSVGVSSGAGGESEMRSTQYLSRASSNSIATIENRV